MKKNKSITEIYDLIKKGHYKHKKNGRNNTVYFINDNQVARVMKMNGFIQDRIDDLVRRCRLKDEKNDAAESKATTGAFEEIIDLMTRSSLQVSRSMNKIAGLCATQNITNSIVQSTETKRVCETPLVAVEIQERYDHDLDEFIGKYEDYLNDTLMRSIILQVVHALYCLDVIFDGRFRHNDMSLNNILVKSGKGKTRVLKMKGCTFTVDRLSPQVAISDFDLAHANGWDGYENHMVMKNFYEHNGITDEVNRSFDTYKFLFHVRYKLNRLITKDLQHTLTFLDSVLPYRDLPRKEDLAWLRINERYPDLYPEQLLNNTYFKRRLDDEASFTEFVPPPIEFEYSEKEVRSLITQPRVHRATT